MRLVDLLRPYMAESTRVIDRLPASLDIGRQLFLPDGVAMDRSTGTATAQGDLGRGTIALTVVGPDPVDHGDPDALFEVLERLEVGGRAAILFGWPAAELPYHRILDRLAKHHCQVLQTAVLDERATPSAAIVERVDRLAPFQDPTGLTVSVVPEDTAQRLELDVRLVDAVMFAELSARAARAAMVPEAAIVSTMTWQDAARQESRIQALEARIAAYEASASLRIGRAIVTIARPLRKAGVGLSRLVRGGDRRS